MLAVVVGAVTVGGAIVSGTSDEGWLHHFWLRTDAASSHAAPGAESVRAEIHRHFHQGVVMLHARQYEHAMTAFHRVLALDSALPEAHVNIGFALIGLERYDAARDFFQGALSLRKEQVNAYYGLAMALDGLGDRGAAIGAMRTYTHLAAPGDPHKRKADAALWEWEVERADARMRVSAPPAAYAPSSQAATGAATDSQ